MSQFFSQFGPPIKISGYASVVVVAKFTAINKFVISKFQDFNFELLNLNFNLLLKFLETEIFQFVISTFQKIPDKTSHFELNLSLGAVHKRRPHKIAKNSPPLLLSAKCPHWLNLFPPCLCGLEKSDVFRAKKCGRLHLKDFSLSAKCPVRTSASEEFPLVREMSTLDKPP